VNSLKYRANGSEKGRPEERDAEHDSDKSAYNTNDADEQFKLAETIGNQETKNKSVKEYFNAK